MAYAKEKKEQRRAEQEESGKKRSELCREKNNVIQSISRKGFNESK